MRPLSPANHSPLEYQAMSFNIDTNKASGTIFVMPHSSSYGYDYDVDWGDGNSQHVTEVPGSSNITSHLYSANKQYTIKIKGSFPVVFFNGSATAPMVTRITCNDVDNIVTGSSFRGCENLLEVIGTDGVSSLWNTFFDCFKFNQNINSWDISSVTSTIGTFAYCSSFNQPLNNWDVSGVVNMESVFFGATSFNQDLSSWDVASVTNMGTMFNEATSFNQDLSSWDVSSVVVFDRMFKDANEFTSNLSGWVTDSATSMTAMFVRCYGFNSDLSSWNTSGVTGMVNMFNGASNFNQNLGAWDIGNVADMTGMFSSTSLSDSNCISTIEGWFTWNGSEVTSSYQQNVTVTFNNNSINESEDAYSILYWLEDNAGWTLQGVTLFE